MSTPSHHKRPRRLFAACHRCHAQKIKCSGDNPCRSCIVSNKECLFPAKERKITVSESYLRKLEADSRKLQAVTQNPTPQSHQETPTDDQDAPTLSTEESNMLNPLFDGQPEHVNEPTSEPGFIGEASCAAFSNRLLQCLDPENYSPSTAGFSNYYRVSPTNHQFTQHRTETMNYDFPERMHAKLLLNVARRFIGNYHPLFLEVTFMRELDAVYRRELTPSTLWLCKFFALMSLGEIYTNRRGVGDNNRVPGTDYYVRAVHMLQDNAEEPSLMQVEVLTLLAWASNILGRVRTAYSYSGTAMRLALSLGMHRSAASRTNLNPVERESRRRTWWVLYFFERFSASKLGQPIGIRDEDIDVELPSIDGLNDEEVAEFLDPTPLLTNIKLARIIGNICRSLPERLTYSHSLLFTFAERPMIDNYIFRLNKALLTPDTVTDIYGIPKSTSGLCIHRVHGILKKLRAWHDELPAEMRIKDRGTPRPVASLHLAYNQCIIQTTRPVLLHLFKTQFQLGSKAQQEPRKQTFSSITLALAESCVNAAQASSRIVEGLFLDGSIATFGYWDAHHIFSAALVLVMSAVMKPTTATSDALETLLSILRSMKNDGNIPAVDFCERLSHIQTRISSLRALGHMEQPIFPDMSGSNRARSADGTDNAQPMDITAATLETQGSINYNNVDILGNPLIGSFLDESRMPWADALFTEDGTLKEFASEIEEQFLFQM